MEDGQVLADHAWARRLRRAIADQPLAGSLIAACASLASVGIDIDLLEEIFRRQERDWRRQSKLEGLGLPDSFMNFALAIYVYTLEDPAVYTAVNGAMYNPARRVQGVLPGPDLVVASSVSSPAAWSWLDDGDRWKPYKGALAASIEAAFGDAKRGTVDLHAGAGAAGAGAAGRQSSTYVINFDDMMQYNMSTRRGRPVRRDVPADPVVDGTWEWQDTDSRWKAYHPSACGQIALACRAGRHGTLLYAGRGNYLVDFSRSVQINMSTRTERPIRHRAGEPRMALPGSDLSPELQACLPYIRFLDTALERLPEAFIFRGRVHRGVRSPPRRARTHPRLIEYTRNQPPHPPGMTE